MQLRIGVWSKPMETVSHRAQAAFWYRLRFFQNEVHILCMRYLKVNRGPSPDVGV